ncbi:MAG TPA: DUF2214 family protein [Candidatus Baltobacteraceae bacterium]
MIIRDALLAYAHFFCIFLFAGLLASELAIFRKVLPADVFRRLAVLDRWYGVAAGLVIATGLSRLFFGLKGSAFYLHNPAFWMKMGLFLIVGLLSIAPTIAYIKWNGRLVPGGSLTLEDSEFRRIRGFLLAQLAIFIFIPLCATFMARGL